MKLTRQGAAFLLAGLVSLVAAPLARALALGAFGLILLVCLAWAWYGTKPPGVTVERSVSADVAREGQRVTVDVRVKLQGSGRGTKLEDLLPTGLEVADGTARATTDGGAETRLSYAVEGRIPGKFRPGPLVVRHLDPLGLVEHVVEAPAGPALKVLPRAEEMAGVPVSSRASMPMSGLHLVGQAGPGSDFYALRDFQPGDAIRDVNWRASARGGRLVVNQREKESQARVTFLFDGRASALTGTRGTNAHVLQLRALASLAHAAARRRDRLRVVVYGEAQPLSLEGSPMDAGQAGLLGAVVEREPHGDAGLADAIRTILPTLRPKSPVVVLTSLLDDPTASDSVRALRALEQDVLVVAPHAADLLQLAGEPPAFVEKARTQHADLLAELRAQGATVLDWSPDEPLALAVLREVGK